MKRLLKILISLIGFGVGIGVSQALRQFLDDARLLVNLSSMGYFFTVLGVYLAGAILFAFIFNHNLYSFFNNAISFRSNRFFNVSTSF